MNVHRRDVDGPRSIELIYRSSPTYPPAERPFATSRTMSYCDCKVFSYHAPRDQRRETGGLWSPLALSVSVSLTELLRREEERQMQSPIRAHHFPVSSRDTTASRGVAGRPREEIGRQKGGAVDHLFRLVRC